MDAMGTMRDLDQIREHDEPGGSSRLMSIALGGMATACVLFAVGVLVGRESSDTHRPPREDPLARLDQLAQQTPAATPTTYPERLAPGAPVTPVAVPSAAPGAVPLAAPLPGAPANGLTMPTTAAAGRPVLMPSVVPAGGMLRIRDAVAGPLLGSPTAVGPMQGIAPAGSDGAFTVQVGSFRTLASAQSMAQRLRERGHRAYVAAPATAPNGAIWHRVRVGPFSTQHEAGVYRADFESRERAPAIVVRRDVTTVIPARVTP